MALGKQLARLFDFGIDDGTGTDTFIGIKGITSFSPSPSKNNADTTDFDSQGWPEHIVASRSISFDVKGHYIEDADTGDRDPGQERIEELAEKVGPEAMAPFRITTPGGTVITMDVSVDATPFGAGGTGGGNDDPTGWSVTLEVSGKPTVS